MNAEFLFGYRRILRPSYMAEALMPTAIPYLIYARPLPPFGSMRCPQAVATIRKLWRKQGCKNIMVGPCILMVYAAPHRWNGIIIRTTRKAERWQWASVSTRYYRWRPRFLFAQVEVYLASIKPQQALRLAVTHLSTWQVVARPNLTNYQAPSASVA
jgi:hypothetical protein